MNMQQCWCMSTSYRPDELCVRAARGPGGHASVEGGGQCAMASPSFEGFLRGLPRLTFGFASVPNEMANTSAYYQSLGVIAAAGVPPCSPAWSAALSAAWVVPLYSAHGTIGSHSFRRKWRARGGGEGSAVPRQQYLGDS